MNLTRGVTKLIRTGLFLRAVRTVRNHIVYYFLDSSLAVPAIHFQVDSRSTAHSWAKWKGNFPETSNLTLCLYHKILKYKKVYNSFLSYAVEEDADAYLIGKYYFNKGAQRGKEVRIM